MVYNHRLSIEWKSPYKESYAVNSHWKSFDDVIGDVHACVRFQNSDNSYSFSIFSLDGSYTIR